MTIAACLIRVRNYSRKRATAVAWQMVKQVFCTKVVGVIFEKRQRALQNLLNYNPRRIKVTLQHEANNPHNENAIAVIVTVIGKGSYQIGYMKKPFAEVYAQLLKKGINIHARFEGVTGGSNNSCYGLNISYVIDHAAANKTYDLDQRNKQPFQQEALTTVTI